MPKRSAKPATRGKPKDALASKDITEREARAVLRSAFPWVVTIQLQEATDTRWGVRCYSRKLRLPPRPGFTFGCAGYSNDTLREAVHNCVAGWAAVLRRPSRRAR